MGRDPGHELTEDTVLALIAGWNLATYAFVWMSVTPGLSFGRAIRPAILALALVLLQGGATGGRVVAALAGIAGLVAAITVKFRTRTLELLEHGWVPITAATLVSHLSSYVVLLACLRAVGVSDAEVSWARVLVVFAFARLATILRLLPGVPGRSSWS